MTPTAIDHQEAMSPGSTPAPLTAAVAGATGYVGRRLVNHLSGDGRPLVALARDPTSVAFGPTVDIRRCDIRETDQVTEALAGCDVAYYLVHAMAGGPGFAQRDRALAGSFAAAAVAAGVRKIVYLGGLGDGDLSEHLASRQETGVVLGSTGVDVVELRAAVVLGAGSISFEMLRYLTERLPAMVCPRWVSTRVQPIAERDLLAYLAAAADVDPGIYEIGCPDVTTYREMMDTYASVRRLRKRLIVKVPLLSPSLSAHWVDLVTPVDSTVSHALIGSLANEVIVHDRAHTDGMFALHPLTSAEAIRAALEEQSDRVTATLFGRAPGLEDGIYTSRSAARVRPGGGLPTEQTSRRSDGASDPCSNGVNHDFDECGGDLGWYGVRRAWALRIALGRLFGEHLALHRPDQVATGAQVDWWVVTEKSHRTLVLATRAWFCGEAWLAYRITGAPEERFVEQVGSLRPRGLLGLAYWWTLWPIHQVAFRAMVHHRARSTARARGTTRARSTTRARPPR